MESKKRFSVGKFEINFTNRVLYTLITLFGVLIFAVSAYALQPGVTPNPGHSIQSISPPAPCVNGQFLKWVYSAASGHGTWICSDVSGGTGSFEYADWFSGSGINFPSDGNKIISIADRNGEGRKLTIQAGNADGSFALNGGELKLSSGATVQGGNSFISLYTSSGGSLTQQYLTTEKMRILGNGNVGIGTTEPSRLLHLKGKGAGLLLEAVGTAGEARPRILFKGNSGNYFNLAHFDDVSPKRISLLYNSESFGEIQGLHLTLDGNVGVGTTGPTTKLQVAGTIYSTTGGFKFPDGTVQTTASAGGGGSDCVAFLGKLTNPPVGYVMTQGLMTGFGNAAKSSCASKCEPKWECPPLNTWQPVSIEGRTCRMRCEVNNNPPTGGDCNYLDWTLTLDPNYGYTIYCK
ncbi:MAG: hypothetical protein KKB79_00515 [Nanoarchaeota archaeon]|nr:hypothetical protein [Nanoarchaeota archaeon]